MAVIPETAPAPASGAPRWRRFLTPWRSPADQPAWARSALLAIAAVAAAGYGRGMAGASVEPFYGATARSMSGSWHDFIFAAFDPAGTVTVDKLPGALWVQALSLRIFGFHIWALVLPQVAEGVLTVLVLYRAVRRLDGPAAGLTAAAVLAVTPITVLLGRGNVAGRCCRSAASSATCRPRRWPRCRPTSAAATCGHSCCRCHRRARTRGCGGSSRTAPGCPRPRTAARSRTRPSSADSPPPSRPTGRLPRRHRRSRPANAAAGARTAGFAGQPLASGQTPTL